MLITNAAVPAAGTFTVDIFTNIKDKEYATIQAVLTYGSGGTTIKVYLQTSFDVDPSGPVTWRDVAALAFATASANKASAVNMFLAATAATAATDGTLTDDTVVNGFMGARWRIKVVVAGTYVSSNLRVDVDLQDTN